MRFCLTQLNMTAFVEKTFVEGRTFLQKIFLVAVFLTTFSPVCAMNRDFLVGLLRGVGPLLQANAQGGEERAPVDLSQWEGDIERQESDYVKENFREMLAHEIREGRELNKEAVAHIEKVAQSMGRANTRLEELEERLDRDFSPEIFDARLEERERELEERRVNKIKWGNSYLWKKSFEWGIPEVDVGDPIDNAIVNFPRRMLNNLHIGIYRKDLIRIPLILGQHFADIYYARFMINKRKEFLVKAITENVDEFLSLLRDVGGDSRAKKDFLNRGLFSKLKRVFTGTNPKAKALTQYLYKEHSFVGWNPFKPDSFYSVALMFIVQEIARKIHLSVEAKDYYSRETYRSYEKTADGEYRQLDGFCFSLVGLLNRFRFPGSMISESLRNRSEKDTYGVSRLSGWWNIFLRWMNSEGGDGESDNSGQESFRERFSEKVLAHPLTPFVLRIIMHLGSVAIFDSVCNDMWIEYISCNSKKLIETLKKYSQAKKENNPDALSKLKEDLEGIIDTAHGIGVSSQAKTMFRWFFARLKAAYRSQLLLYGVFITPLVCLTIPLLPRIVEGIKTYVPLIVDVV